MDQIILSKIKITKNDITKIQNENAIVCSTNYSLNPVEKSEKSLDYLIHNAAGKKLDELCWNLCGCALGQAKITDACDLRKKNNIKYIIHTVGPAHYSLSRERARVVLSECYTNTLIKARENGIHSIVFPCIGLGHKGYQHRDQALVAFAAVYNWISKNRDYEIIVTFCCYDQHDFDVYNNVFKEYEEKNSLQNFDQKKEPVGLVLAGGGARGAFQMGAWSVLEEAGIARQISGFSGTSIGSINTVLFLGNFPLNQKIKMWENFKQNQLTRDLEQESLRKMIELVSGSWNKDTLSDKDIFSTIVKVPTNETINKVADSLEEKVDPIRKVIMKPFLGNKDNEIEKISIVNSVAGVLAPFTGERFYESWEGKNISEISNLVLDSAKHQLLFYPHRMDSEIAVDGGNHAIFHPDSENSNVPIQPLYDMGYRKFIVVYCDDNKENLHKLILKESSRYGDASFCRIFPEEDLGMMHKIDTELTRSRIESGKKAMRKQLIGPGNSFDDLNWWPSLTASD